MSLSSEQADNRSLLISELKREPQESQEKLSKEALFELEFVDGSISVALSLLMVEKPPLSSPQLHLKISLIPPIKDNEQLPRQNQNLEVLWPNRSMIQQANELFITMNDFLKAVEEHQKKYSNCGLESKFTKNSTGFGSKTKQYGCFFQTKKR